MPSVSERCALAPRVFHSHAVCQDSQRRRRGGRIALKAGPRKKFAFEQKNKILCGESKVHQRGSRPAPSTCDCALRAWKSPDDGASVEPARRLIGSAAACQRFGFGRTSTVQSEQFIKIARLPSITAPRASRALRLVRNKKLNGEQFFFAPKTIV